jgi:HPt (histidine-containing phosphotransfer) domain-containing protein
MSIAESHTSTDDESDVHERSVLDDDTLTMLEQECDGALEGLLQLFLSECEKRVGLIEGFGSGARNEIEREAHTVKGAAISFGCPALSAAARDLETAAGRGETGLESLVQMVVRTHGAARVALELRYPGLRSPAARP